MNLLHNDLLIDFGGFVSGYEDGECIFRFYDCVSMNFLLFRFAIFGGSCQFDSI